jgi:UDP-N-acetylmuramoyl-tripeptide--D-alanyl-D-alanine ligase
MITTEELYYCFLQSTGVCTDTRKIKEGCLFFALKGGNFNGNEFAQKALELGAKWVVIDEEAFQKGDQYLLVKDVLSTLQDVARHHRRTFSIPVIGLTGSNGKTTNKELLHAVLSKKYHVHATKGNLNNHIGVPLTLLEMPKDCEMAIIEMGANHQKEIAMLSRICEPTHGFITNIGKAHLEGFGGVEGIKMGKGELYDFLKKSNGTVFINENDEVLMTMAKEKGLMLTVRYGNDERALASTAVTPFVQFTLPPFFDEKETDFNTNLSGAYNFDNMQTAFAIGSFFNVEAKDAAQALATYESDNNRSQLVQNEHCVIHLDAYNANPSSMEAAINNFAALVTDRKKAVVLGDMFELGEDSEKEHKALGALVASHKFDLVVLYGHHITPALAYLPKAYYFSDKFSIHNWTADFDFTNYEVLIKGSRGTALETLVPFV